MDEFKVFKTFKERGEWTELLFMAKAMFHGYKISKPWGESSAFDVGVASGRRILRVQVKSTSNRISTGYYCQFKPNFFTQDYTLDQIDFFAGYVIPQDVWYIIPARLLLGAHRKTGLMLCPMGPPGKACYNHERYREAWPLMQPRQKKVAPTKAAAPKGLHVKARHGSAGKE
jgi:hypothetical protein